MAEQQRLKFDERFLDRHAGAIILDPSVAIVELVANAWDAWATKVDIIWPTHEQRDTFSITDNGKGMTEEQFLRRWETIDYNRATDEPGMSMPPPDLPGYAPRHPYGRNGRGRHAAFRFGNPYIVRTWQNSREIQYRVKRGLTAPFDLDLVSTSDDVPGHGTQIMAETGLRVALTAQEVREVLGTRFLSDPNFTVFVDGVKVSFEDVPASKIQEMEIEIPGYGMAKLTVIDTLKADRTTRQHGIAWWVNARLVGQTGWVGFDDERILDGRTSEAKRFIFIAQCDFLADLGAPLVDWTGFDQTNAAWIATRKAVHDKIKEFLSSLTADRRREIKEAIRETLHHAVVVQLPSVSRERWNDFVDTVIDTCPTIKADEIEQVAHILANLELSNSKYGLIKQLHGMKPGDLDELETLLGQWTVRTAKLALDEVQTRLKLIEELDLKLRDSSLDEVGDLQPLFERSLWVFGPEFESLEFTSNRGMTTVIRELFGRQETGSRLRADFVMIPDGSVGFYSRDAHDLSHEVAGVASVIVAEIKKVGVRIGSTEKAQPWKYVRELIEKGLLTDGTPVTCFVLGSEVDPAEVGDDTKGNGRVLIRAMSYDTFIRRAEKRMLGLRNKLKDAPFLKDLGLDGNAFLAPPSPKEPPLPL